MWFNKSISLRIISFLLIAIAIVGLQKKRYDTVAAKTTQQNYLEKERDSKIALNIRNIVPSFGFDNLFADSLYLDFVQYFGDKPARKVTGYSLVPEYFSAIADRDPQFTDAHLTLSTANSMYAGKAEETVKIMDNILESTSPLAKDSYLIWSIKAVDESTFLGDVYSARYSYEKAAELALRQANEKSYKIVTLNKEKAQFLATEPDTTKAQITAWKSALPHAVKESEKQEIKERIQALETQLNLK